ncbi:GNAT family N-acetyltransferase [Glutamicibacter bergerei]
MLLPSSVTLRPFTNADAEFFAALATDKRVVRFIGYGQPWDRQTITACVREALEQEPLDLVGASRWFVATEANESVGIVFSTRQQTCVELGYWVSADQWGRGIGGAMLDSALAIVPRAFGITKFSARVAPGNTASARMLFKRGFMLEKRDEELEHYMLG